MCIESLIGLKECSLPEPSTGLYIDELGINQTFLGQIITDQYVSGVDLFIDKRQFAWRKLSSDVLLRLTPAMKADTVIEGKRIGQVLTDYSNLQLPLGSGRYGGIRLKINPNNLSYLNLYISDINLAIDDTNINVDVYIFDMTTLKLVKIINYLQGNVEQFIGEEFKAGRKKLDLAIVYESQVNAVKFIPKKGSCYDCGGNVREAHICPFVDAVGIELTTDGTNVLSSASSKYTRGMSLNYNVNCDRQSWMCSIGGLMAMPLAYLTAAEIYNYALTIAPNQRVNTVVTINKGSKPFATSPAFEGIVAARDAAIENYNNELNALIQNMRLPDDNHCWDCRKNYKYVTALP
jgi:hypothetical protein